jgi:hypothetical protein
MAIIKALGKTILTVGGLILLLIMAVNIIGTRSDIVDGVTGTKIKQVKPGMTIEQVISILGSPYSINALKGIHNNSCKKRQPRLYMEVNSSTNIKATVDRFYSEQHYCCEGNKQDMQTKNVTLTFTQPVIFSKNYPMLWVHFDSDYKVSRVYAKSYEGILGLNDRCIYSLSWAFDAKTMEMRQDTVTMFINNELFKKSFH